MQKSTLELLRDMKKYMPYILMGMVISGLEILGELLDELSLVHAGIKQSVGGIKRLFLWGTRGIVLWITISLALCILWKAGKRMYSGAPSKCPLFMKKIYVWIAILVTWIPCFLAYFPGIYSYDGEPQLIQYTSGQFDNHHPVLHTLLMGGCYDFGQWLMAKGIPIDGIAFYSMIQMFLLSFAFATVIRFLAKKNAGKGIVWLSFVMFSLFPATPVMAISTTKDSFFTAFFVLFIIKICDIITTKQGAKSDYFTAVIYASFCMLFRRNACYVFLIVLVALFVSQGVSWIRKRKEKEGLYARLFVVLLIAFAVFSVSEKTLMYSTDAVRGESAEALSVPLMQIARAYMSNQEAVTEKYGEELFRYISPLGLSNYRPLISDGVKQQFNNALFAEDKLSFFKLYFQMFADYPGSYVKAFLYMTKGDWHLMDLSYCEVYKDWWRDRTGYLITDATPVFALGLVNKSDLLPNVKGMYESIVTDCCFTKIPLLQIAFAPALYVMLAIICGLVLLIKKKRDAFFIWSFIGIYLLTIIAGPCVLVRYVFPLMMLIPVMSSLVWDQ